MHLKFYYLLKIKNKKLEILLSTWKQYIFLVNSNIY